MQTIKLDFALEREYLIDNDSKVLDEQINLLFQDLRDIYPKKFISSSEYLEWESCGSIINYLVIPHIKNKYREHLGGLNIDCLTSVLARYSIFFVAFSGIENYTSATYEKTLLDFEFAKGFQLQLLEDGRIFRKLLTQPSKSREALILFTSRLIEHLQFKINPFVFSGDISFIQYDDDVKAFLTILSRLLNGYSPPPSFDLKETWGVLINQLNEKASQILAMETLQNSVNTIAKDAELVLETRKQMQKIEPLEIHWEDKRKHHLRNVKWIFGLAFCFLIIGLLVAKSLLSFDGTCPTMPASTWVQFFDYAIRCWQVEKAILFVSVWAWTFTQIFHFLRSQWHLYNDASERVVMAKSYKRLQSDNEFGNDQGQTNKASFMILEALLRQADDGLMKDSPKTNLLPIGLIKQSND